MDLVVENPQLRTVAHAAQPVNVARCRRKRADAVRTRVMGAALMRQGFTKAWMFPTVGNSMRNQHQPPRVFLAATTRGGMPWGILVSTGGNALASVDFTQSSTAVMRARWERCRVTCARNHERGAG